MSRRTRVQLSQSLLLEDVYLVLDPRTSLSLLTKLTILHSYDSCQTVLKVFRNHIELFNSFVCTLSAEDQNIVYSVTIPGNASGHSAGPTC